MRGQDHACVARNDVLRHWHAVAWHHKPQLLLVISRKHLSTRQLIDRDVASVDWPIQFLCSTRKGSAEGRRSTTWRHPPLFDDIGEISDPSRK
jgi:hypothetical protein